MKNCDYYNELISAEIDGELGENEREELAAHLLKCGKCAQMRSFMNEMSRASSELDVDPPPDFSKNVMRRIHQTEKPSVLRIIGGKAFTVVAAAAVLAVVIYTSGGIDGLSDRFMPGSERTGEVSQTGDAYYQENTIDDKEKDGGFLVGGLNKDTKDDASPSVGRDATPSVVIGSGSPGFSPTKNVTQAPELAASLPPDLLPGVFLDGKFYSKIGVWGASGVPAAFKDYNPDFRSTDTALYYLVPFTMTDKISANLKSEGYTVIIEKGDPSSETSIFVVVLE